MGVVVSVYIVTVLMVSAVLCDLCCLRPQETIGRLLLRVHRTEKRLQNVHSICMSCSAIPATEPVYCESLDCPWLYERKKLEDKAESMNAMQELVEELVDLHMGEDISEENPEPGPVVSSCTFLVCETLMRVCRVTLLLFTTTMLGGASARHAGEPPPVVIIFIVVVCVEAERAMID